MNEKKEAAWLRDHLPQMLAELDRVDRKGISVSTVREKFPEISQYHARVVISFFRYEQELKTFFANNLTRQNIQLRDAKNRATRQLDQMIRDITDLERNISFWDSITTEPEYIQIEPNYDNKEAKGCAISVLSDVHFEERVDKKLVYGYNEYNPDIAKQRISNYFHTLLKLVNIYRKDIPIDTLVVGFLGDMITGYIHEELQEDNWLSPTEATMGVRDCLMSGLKFLSEEGNFKKIIIPCAKGNHGRTTKKKRFSTGYKNSYEWMMYHDMKSFFESWGGYDNLEWIIPTSELTYMEVYGKRLRFGHGDQFRYAGGVGGISIPLMKWLYRNNQWNSADMTYLGHWHQLLKPAQNCWLNGSVIGYNGYGAALGFSPEPPQQLFSLLDSKRGFTLNTPILLQ